MRPLKHEDYLSVYLHYLKKDHYSPRTLEGHGNTLRIFLEFLSEQGIEELKEVRQKDIDEYQTYLFYYRDQKNKALRMETQSQKLLIVRSFFRVLVQRNYLLFNPAQDIRLPRERKRLPNDFLSLKEIRKLFQVPNLSTLYGYRDRAILEVLYSTGIYSTELATLEVEDVDLENGFLTIGKGQNLKARTIPLTQIAADFLKEYLLNVRPSLVKAPSGKLLFVTKSGQGFDRSAIHKKLSALGKKAGVEKRVTARAIRHSMAVELLKGKVNLREIQEILGHKRLSSTQIYAKINKSDLKRVHRKSHPSEQIETEVIHYEGEKDLG